MNQTITQLVNIAKGMKQRGLLPADDYRISGTRKAELVRMINHYHPDVNPFGRAELAQPTARPTRQQRYEQFRARIAPLDEFRTRLRERGCLSFLRVENITTDTGRVLPRKVIKINEMAGLKRLIRNMWYVNKHRRVWLSFNDMSIQGRFLGQTAAINIDMPTSNEAVENLVTAIGDLIDHLVNKQLSDPNYAVKPEDLIGYETEAYYENRLVASDITMITASTGVGAPNQPTHSKPIVAI